MVGGVSPQLALSSSSPRGWWLIKCLHRKMEFHQLQNACRTRFGVQKRENLNFWAEWSESCAHTLTSNFNCSAKAWLKTGVVHTSDLLLFLILKHTHTAHVRCWLVDISVCCLIRAQQQCFLLCLSNQATQRLRWGSNWRSAADRVNVKLSGPHVRHLNWALKCLHLVFKANQTGCCSCCYIQDISVPVFIQILMNLKSILVSL